MASSTSSIRVYLLANPDKEGADRLLQELKEFATTRCELLGAQLGVDGRVAIDAGAQRIIVLGGDGTLIGVARSLGSDQVPLLGVNMGKFGFLTEFSHQELMDDFERAISDPGLVQRRAAIEVTLQHNGAVRASSMAVNDCVIQGGPPFRPTTLGLSINGAHLTELRGDGLIVCTPSGSTAHNLSAGGPILQPGVDAIVLTPLCPHSLTHRPLVIERDSIIGVRALNVNRGTTAIIDGQVPCPVHPGDLISIKRFHADFLPVLNPRYTRWHKLTSKLYWGKAPNYD